MTVRGGQEEGKEKTSQQQPAGGSQYFNFQKENLNAKFPLHARHTE